MRSALLSLVAACLCFAFLAVATPPPEAHAGGPRKVRVVGGTDGHYYAKSKRFRAWGRVQIEGGDPANKKVTGREKITHFYMPSSVTTFGIHKAPVEGPFKRAVRKLSGKAPPLDGTRLEVDLGD